MKMKQNLSADLIYLSGKSMRINGYTIKTNKFCKKKKARYKYLKIRF